MNPFTYARLTITTARPVAEVHAVIDRLRVEGFQDGARQYRVRGSRYGDRFALSLGWPVLGGAEPVLFGSIRSVASGSEVDLTLGSRLTMRVGLGLAALLAIVEAMNAAGIETQRTLLFVANVGEEGLGDLNGIRYLFQKSPYRNRLDAFISIDGTSLQISSAIRISPSVGAPNDRPCAAAACTALITSGWA